MRFILLNLALIASPISANSLCYWIDGTEASGFSPCPPPKSVGASMCCNARDGLKCSRLGLCESAPCGPPGPYDNDTSYWRAGCSDKTWQDPACLAIAPCKLG